MTNLRATPIRWLAAASTVAALQLISLDSRADTTGDARRAQAAYDVQDWPTAIKEYRAAYQAEQKPEYLWGLAQSLRMSGDCKAAIMSYKAYRRAEVTANQGTAAELMITRCEADLAKQEADAAKAASTPAATAPAAAPAPQAGPSQPAPTAAPAAPPPPEPKKFYQDVLGDVLFVAGAAAAGVGGYFLLSGNSQVKEGNDAATYGKHADSIDEGKKKQTIGAVVLGAGGALLIGATIRFITFDPTPNEQVSLGLDGITFRGRF
ncbi:MAG: hypothetical protein QM756_08995 [Polyangiaceae bacterium]